MSAHAHADCAVRGAAASGFIGSWIVHDLLRQGYTVHACVRSKARPDKVDHLLAMHADRDLRGRLELFEVRCHAESHVRVGMQAWCTMASADQCSGPGGLLLLGSFHQADQTCSAMLPPPPPASPQHTRHTCAPYTHHTGRPQQTRQLRRALRRVLRRDPRGRCSWPQRRDPAGGLRHVLHGRERCARRDVRS